MPGGSPSRASGTDLSSIVLSTTLEIQYGLRGYLDAASPGEKGDDYWAFTDSKTYEMNEAQEKWIKDKVTAVIDSAKKCQSQTFFLSGRCMDEVLIVTNIIKRFFPKTAVKLKFVLKLMHDVVEKNLASLDDSISDRMCNVSPFSSSTNLGGKSGILEPIYNIESVKKPEDIATNKLLSLDARPITRSENSADDFGFFDISTHSQHGAGALPGGGGGGAAKQLAAKASHDKALSQVIRTSVGSMSRSRNSIADLLDSAQHG